MLGSWGEAGRGSPHDFPGFRCGVLDTVMRQIILILSDPSWNFLTISKFRPFAMVPPSFQYLHVHSIESPWYSTKPTGLMAKKRKRKRVKNGIGSQPNIHARKAVAHALHPNSVQVSPILNISQYCSAYRKRGEKWKADLAQKRRKC